MLKSVFGSFSRASSSTNVLTNTSSSPVISSSATPQSGGGGGGGLEGFENYTPLTLTLNSNRLVFVNGRQWVSEAPDLEKAAQEISVLIDSRDELASKLEDCRAENDSLRLQISEVNDLKIAAMTMLMEERQRNERMNVELAAYKEELKEAYRVITELQKMMPQ